MTHLLAISVGPVQEFIAAARRTRDLWFGSFLLSEISRAVAKAIVERGGELIFPANLKADNIANKILAEVNDPKSVADHAKRKARACWEEYATAVRQKLDQDRVKVIVPAIWDEQLPDAIDFFAAWVTQTSDYQADRKRVERLLAGRKNCRDFLPAKGRAGVPKSSLDGQRESVLLQPPYGADRKTFRDNWPKDLRLSAGEQLDVIGVTKRLGKKKGDSDRYPSVARVAAETWLQGVRDRTEFAALKEACQHLRGLHTVREEHFRYFPYEGTIIYKDRHADLRNELGLGDNALDEVAAILKKIGGAPNPYLAVLVADGDKMGETISRLQSADDHRAYSEALSGFAGQARQIVNDHNGVLIYAGGDDVLAFVPVGKCLDCARKLHDNFGSSLKEFKNEQGRQPTLSVGIAIGHFMENMEDLRAYGLRAEKSAKAVEGKNALAVHLYKRGGAPVQVRGRWDEDIDKRLSRFAGFFNQGNVPSKLPYELRAMARAYEGWSNELAASAIQKDVRRLIAKKQSKSLEPVCEVLVPPYDGEMSAAKLLGFAEELLVARHLASALQQVGKNQAQPTEAVS